MKHLFLIIILCLTTISWAQNLTNGLIFSDDLNTIANDNPSNLVSVSNDEVRALVVKFAPNKEAYQLHYKRDSAISVSFWLRPQNIHLHPGAILGEQNVFYFRYLANNQLQFNLWQKQDIETPAVLCEDQWQHIGFTLTKQGELSIYFNGDLITRDKISSNWWKTKGQTLLGKDLFNVAAEGFMDELKVWNKVLSEEEMNQAFENSVLLPPLNYGLKLFLPLSKDFRNLSDNKVELSMAENILFSAELPERSSAEFIYGKSYAKVNNITFHKQKTISLWIKTDTTESPIALIGNSDFCLRYLPKTGRLWYSVPMNFGIKSLRTKPPVNDWTHVAVALNYNHKIDYYINGEKIDSQEIEEGTGNANYIEIGKSIWNNYYGGSMSELAIWDRKLSDLEIKEVYNGKLEILLSDSKKSNTGNYFIVLSLILVLAVLFTLLRNRRKNRKNKIEKEGAPSKLPQKNAIYFLQTFRAYNNEMTDFSDEFSPTIIRLFALILIYPEVYKRNISSVEMSDLLWPGESSLQQKNNRSTNVHRLRTIFKQIPGLALHYKNKTWQIETPDTVFIDIESFESFLQLLNYKSSVHNIKFDKRVYTDEFDAFIRLYNDKRLSILTQKCDENNTTKEWNSLAYFSKLWLTIDTLSDEALKYRVSALLQLAQKQNALNTYEMFCKNYTLLLNEDYPISFDRLS